ncbi:MAG: helix-turn-helix transcriptional regulator [Planctomycetota bacterium]
MATEHGVAILLPTGSSAKSGEQDFVDIIALGNPEVGKRLASYRKKAGLSQEQMAERSGGVLTQRMVSRLEKQPEKAPLEHFLVAKQILNRSFDEILNKASHVIGGA